MTKALFAAPADEADAENDSKISAIEPLYSVELTDDPDVPNVETEVEEEHERAWDDWRVRIGALLLARPHPRLIDEEGGTVCAPDFYFPISAASDVSLRLPGSVVDLDFRYFGVSQAVADTGPLAGTYSETHYEYSNVRAYGRYGVDLGRPNSQAPLPLYEPAPQVYSYVVEIPYENRASLTSWLQSAELNVRRQLHPSVAMLAGIRYVQFREQWSFRQDSSGFTLGGDTIARNELFGFQIGSESLLYSFKRLRLEGGLKAGIFGNAASSAQTGWLGFHDLHLAAREDARRGAVAFVGDINVSVAVQLTRNIALRWGNQLLWLAGVSTASDQLAALDHDHYVTKTNGSMFFAGAMVGLECGW